MSRLRQLITAGLALMGFGRSAHPTATLRAEEPTKFADVPVATEYNYGTRITEGGNPPDVWGCSAACARMVRKNRRLALRRARFEARGRTKGGRS